MTTDPTSRAYEYDLFVIGAGSGGVRAARIAAGHGAKVAVAEERRLGGTCVNVGCIPKKLLVYAAHFAGDFHDAAGFGWTLGAATHDWARLVEAKDREIRRLNEIYRNLLVGAGCTIFEERATLVDAHTIQVGGAKVTADKVLVATGGWPVLPDTPGAGELAITSNEAFRLPKLPRRVVIAGGGYIAVEFAGIFAGLGAEVTQLYRGPLFLRGFDLDLRRALALEMAKARVDLRFGTTIRRIEQGGDSLVVHLSDGWMIETDCVLYAIGRKPNTAGLGLEESGVRLDGEGAVVVGGDYRTSVENIYAVGDVTNRINLTPVAIAEGHALADALFSPRRREVSYDNVPTAVFSTPALATVGLTEEEARALPAPIDVYRSTFKPLRATLGGGDEKVLVKLVVERESDRVLGCHMMGAEAPEIIQGFAVAMNAGATKAVFDRTIGIHPTAAEELVTMRTRAPEPDPSSD